MMAGIETSSDLVRAEDRFLCRLLEYAFDKSWRTAEDFLRHFTPPTIIKALGEDDALRVALLVATTGVHEKIARKKSPASAAEDLTLALDEGMTTAATVLELFPPTAQVRFLDREKLWEFLVEDEFWKASKADREKAEVAAARLTFVLQAALDEEVLSLADISDGISFEVLTSSLPPELLRTVLTHALKVGRDGMALDEERLLEVVELGTIIECVNFNHVYDRVVLAKLGGPLGFLGAGWEPESDKGPTAKGRRRKKGPKTPKPKISAKNEPRRPGTPSAPSLEVNSWAPGRDELETLSGEVVDDDMAAQVARRGVEQRLSNLQRLPPGHKELSISILASIESMYADLAELTDPAEQEACIRESFPNENHLRQALLALIELLDPSVDTTGAAITAANASELIKILMFEEKRRRESATGRSNPPFTPGARATK